jgi:hypothetical protein
VNVPEIMPRTFREVPFASRVVFHRGREGKMKRDIEVCVSEVPRKLTHIPPPPAPFLQKLLAPLPDDWIGSLNFTWTEEERWQVTTKILDEFDASYARSLLSLFPDM